MNKLLYQFQTIGFACDKEYHKGMKEVKKRFEEINQFKRKALKDFNNVDNVINSISDIIEKRKREPLSKSIDCSSFSNNKQQRLQSCLNKMGQIDYDQQQLDKESGIRTASIFSDRIAAILPQKELIDKELNQELAINCHLHDTSKFGQIMEQALLLHSFHKDCSEKLNQNLSLLDPNNFKTRRERAKFQQRNEMNQKSVQAQEYYMKKFQLEHMRLKDKLIDSDQKTLIDHKYCQDRNKGLRSAKNKKRIQQVTEKINRNKILVIQNLFKSGHDQKSQKADEVLRFLELYSKVDRENNQIFSQVININGLFSMKIESYLRKIFFKFSKKECDDLNELYKYINLQGYLECFHLSHLDIEDKELITVYQNNVKIQNLDQDRGLNFNFFRDSLIDIANCISLLPNKEEKLLRLVDEYLLEIYDQVLDVNEIRILTIKSYQEFNNLFFPLIQKLFLLYGQQIKNYNFNDQRLNLDKIILVLMQIKVFPQKFSKQFIRHHYCYSAEQDEGLDLNQFQHFLNLMALSQNKRISISRELNNIIQYNQYKLQSKFEDITEYEQKIFRKIMIFYFHSEFLNLQNVEQD
ncbi:unnamed protein product [Paramecium primaurelia]|uniref:Uncharacterized protein n=1 Tax=Paramecium primaurelia TaxID=5886 RepID=A0A8S1N1H0_PARPR|nr:unnamed protein product [Paramecium primaurelia]